MVRSRWASALPGSNSEGVVQIGQGEIKLATVEVDATPGGVGLAQAEGQLGQRLFRIMFVGDRLFRGVHGRYSSDSLVCFVSRTDSHCSVFPDVPRLIALHWLAGR